jgi:hypothetical protein
MHQFTAYLRDLHLSAGRPPIRQLAKVTGYGKTTIADALSGRAIPTWDVMQTLIAALDGDETEAKARWVAVKGSDMTGERVPEWLIRVHEPVQGFWPGRGLVEACLLARDDPRAAIGDGWEVLRVPTLHLSARHYEDVAGSWSSNVVDTLRRAREDGRLPPWVPEQAALLHEMYVRSLMTTPDEPGALSALAAVQFVNLAYRLGWLVWEAAHPREEERRD